MRHVLRHLVFSRVPHYVENKMLLKRLKECRSPASTANTEIENLEPQCADFCPLLFFQRILGATHARILRWTFSLAGD